MIPISTDAPVYHYPVSTVAMIVANVVFFVAFCLNAERAELEFFDSDGKPILRELVEIEFNRRMRENPEDANAYLESLDVRETKAGAFELLSLQFGYIRPWQWLTNNFMHAGWGHLIGNMIFLWAFGMVVEGKLGNVAFAAVYLAIGVVCGMLLQLGGYFFVEREIALGASAAIFGLLALCVAWAPANEFTCFLFVFYRAVVFDISIIAFAMFFLAKEVLFLLLGGFQLDSELLHILGFFVAFPLGVYLLRSGRVDCEGWDLFSYLNGTTGKDSRYAKRRKPRKASK